LLALAAGFLPPAVRADPSTEVLSPASVNAWVEVMRTNSPALAGAGQRTRAAKLNAEGVRRFEDPKVVFGGAVFSEQGMKPSEEGNLIYGVEQKLPIMGKETAARRRAEAEAGVEAARAEAVFQESRRNLAQALFAAALARRTVELERADHQSLAASLAAAESRYRSGADSSVDVLRLQSEQARHLSEMQTAEQRLAAAQAGVNRWLGRAPETPLPAWALPDVAAPVPFSPALVRLATQAAPRLRVLDRERQVAEAALTASRRQRRPDLGLGVEGRQYTGDGGFRQGMFTVSLNLPWFNRDRYQRDIQRDEARLRAAGDDAADLEVALRDEIFRLTTEIASARREALNFREEILPRSDAAQRAALSAWSSGRGSLTDVLDTRRAWIEAQLEEARAIASQWSALSELVLSCGLTDLEMLWMLDRPNPPAANEINPAPKS
jgi:outer membrane protein TolC